MIIQNNNMNLAQTEPGIIEEVSLVTGAAGLLGIELVNQLLAKGIRVKAVYNKTPIKITHHPLLQVVHCDLLDVVALEEIMEGVSVVYHCAGMVSFSPNKKNVLYKVNVDATANVVNAALQAGVKKMVHVSSVAALGRLKEHEPINEKSQWTTETNNSVYGHSKYLGELEVWRGVAEGLDAVIVNPTIILGPGNWKEGSTAIFKNIYDGFNWFSEGTTGFVDVRDVCKAMILLKESPITAERFIISAENTTYKEVFNLIADAFKKKRPGNKVTPLIASVVWRIEKLKNIFSGREPLITKETAATAFAKVHFDNAKLKQHLPGFEYTPLKETIEYTCAVLKEKMIV